MFAWFFLSALYLQLVLGYSPLQVGLAFLPANLIMGAFSLGISAKLVMRFGIKLPLAAGLLLAAAGLGLFARAPVGGHFAVDVLPSMILLGFGAGIAFNPVLLAAMGDVEPERVRPRLGHRQHLVHDGRRARPGRPREHRGIAYQPSARLRARAGSPALDAGYQTAFVIGALFALAAAGIGALLLDARSAIPAGHAASEHRERALADAGL